MGRKKTYKKPKRHKKSKKKQIRVGFGFVACFLALLTLLIALPHIKDSSSKEERNASTEGAF